MGTAGGAQISSLLSWIGPVSMSGEQWIGGPERSVLDDSQLVRYLEPATQAEVAQALGFTREGARQIEIRALKKRRQEMLKRGYRFEDLFD